MKLEYMSIVPGQGHAAGRKLLETMYRSHTGQAMPEICLTPRGKPYFQDGDLHFSISHTKGHVFCVLSEAPVGIDAEEQDRDIDLRLAEKILSPAERAQYDLAPDQRRALLTFWVLKEAAAKCTGEGLKGYPRQTNFTLDDPRVQTIDGCIVAVIQSEQEK